jgi:hypothetical protein
VCQRCSRKDREATVAEFGAGKLAVRPQATRFEN